jgi:hypothetical protein
MIVACLSMIRTLSADVFVDVSFVYGYTQTAELFT